MQKCIIRSVNFNEDFSCFTCCGENGALIFNVNPLAYLGQIDGDKLGSLSSACMLGRSNIFALVGGGKTPKFAENAVIIWDESKKEFVLEYAFSSPVLGLLLRKSALVVLLHDTLHIFDFPGRPEKRVAALDCWPATTGRGLATLSGRLLAFPARGQAGTAQLVRLDRLDSAPVLLQAHRAALVAMQLSREADLLATAGARGTLVRLFDTSTRRLIREFRRGADPAMLFGLAWSPAGDWVCAASDKGTVHLWSVSGGGGGAGGGDAGIGGGGGIEASGSSPTLHRQQQLGAKFLSDLSVDGAKRADVSFSLPPDTPSTVAFTGPQSVVVLTLEGAYHRWSFTHSCATREAYDVFTDMALDSEFG